MQDMNYTADELKTIIAEAKTAAAQAAQDYVADWTAKTGGNQYGEPMYCGFAWTSIYKVKGNTQLGRALVAAGVRQSYDRSFQLYNPAGWHGQSMDVKEAGARAAALVLRKYGFEAYMGSRAD
jgi:hypothetical protein